MAYSLSEPPELRSAATTKSPRVATEVSGNRARLSGGFLLDKDESGGRRLVNCMACVERGTPYRIRPKLHFTAKCWINDPCAPGYDQRTKLYHLFYQCNPHSMEWGSISWGHVTSSDMINWVPAANTPALVPDQTYDRDGVFTGCWVPALSADDKVLRVVYSSVQRLPFHWSMPPYPRNAAGLAMATSEDAGVSWAKITQNPFITGEPPNMQVTGFRDPYMAPWAAMDQAPGKDYSSLYGLVSGGIQDSGPTCFLYEVQLDNPTSWTYIAPLVDVSLRYQPSQKWSGNYGINWECVNFVTLESDSESREFLIIGAEGDVEKEHLRNHRRPEGRPPRTVRTQLWMSGTLLNDGNGVRFQYGNGGYLDHGPYYAAASFIDPVSKRRIVHGWIPEEDIPVEFAREKGWNGSLAIPREIFLLQITNVRKALRSQLSELGCFECKIEPDGSMTLLTLGIRPIKEVANWQRGCKRKLRHGEPITLPNSDNCGQFALFNASTSTWELRATIAVQFGCQAGGFYVRHTADMAIRTCVTFSVIDETIAVDRIASTIDAEINRCPDIGAFTLFERANIQRSPTRPSGAPNVDSSMETLQLRIFSDGDILEVFANDRFALATMVYSNGNGPSFGGITAFARGTSKCAVFEEVTLWDGLNPH